MMMKKLIYLFSAVALLCACEKADDFNQPVQGGTASGDLPEVIYATVADNNDENDKTRTVVAEDGKTILWNTGDAVSAFFSGISNAQYQYNGEDAVATAELKWSMAGYTGIELSHSYAVYPYHEGNTSVLEGGVEKLKVNFPAEQTFAANSFGRGASVMVGVGETADDTDFYFRNACGYLVIKLYDDYANGPCRVKTITLTALGGEKIAGAGLITASHGADPVVAMTDEGTSTITLNCGDAGVELGRSANSATEFWFAMPPTTLEGGFKISVTPTEGAIFEMQTTTTVEITRNEIQPMAALRYLPNTPGPNQFFYTKSANTATPIAFDEDEQPFNVDIESHYYDARINKLVIQCEAPITEIKDEAFRGGYNNGYFLTSVSLPSQLEVIGARAFYTNQIREIVIPSSVTLIKDRALRASGLNRITFLWSEKSLQIRAYDGVATPEQSGNGAFRDENLEYISIDRHIEYTDEDGEENGNISAFLGLFTNTSSTTNVVIGPNMSTIPASMFAGVNMEKLVIPGNITSIGKNNFYNCKSLEEIVFEPSPTNASLTMDGTNNTGDTGPFYSQYDEDNLERISLNREINYILEGIDGDDEGLFSGRSALRTVELGEQVRTISDYMFAGTETLTSVTLPEGLTTIGENAFSGCVGLTSMTFPGSVTSIGNLAFDDCTNLSSLTFEGSTTNLRLGFQDHASDKGPFYDSPLTYINLNRQIDYIYDDLDATDEGVFANVNTSTPATVVLGENVRAIHNWMFYGVPVSSLTIPAGIDAIGYEAFGNNSRLTQVTCEGSTPATLDYLPFSNTSQITIRVPSAAVLAYKNKWVRYNTRIVGY